MTKQTKALIYDKYGQIDVLHFGEITLPSPAKGELIVKVEAIALNPKDALVRKGKFKWLTGSFFPKVVGLDFAGQVVEKGPDVTLGKGASIYGSLNEITSKRGTAADFLHIQQDECAPMPSSLNFEEAATLPLAAQTALQALRDKIKLKKRDSILIHGASGGVGVYAIQIAKAYGAIVTTTSSAKNLEFCKSLGADITLDYTAGDPFSGGEVYDGIFDVFGNQSFENVKHALTATGIYVTTVPSYTIFFDTLKTLFSSQKARFILVRSNTFDLIELDRLVATGQLKPVIDKVFPLDDYKEAFKLLESKRARGKIVLKI